MLKLVNGTVYGMVNGGTDPEGADAGEIAFIVELDGTDPVSAKLVVTQILPILHPTDTLHDENLVLSLASGILGVKLLREVEDGDDDEVNDFAVADITDDISFDDDGPVTSVTLSGAGLAALELDETIGNTDRYADATEAGTGDNNSGDDEPAPAGALGKVMTAIGALAPLFTTSADAGSDGEKSDTQTLSLVLLDGGSAEVTSLATNLDVSDAAGVFGDDSIVLKLVNGTPSRRPP